ncbi:uncharacterized transporter slc-17.2-like isoform X1 [Argonauta hians]
MLAGYFYGYVVSNLLGGLLADKYGGRIVEGASLCLAAIFTLLHPSLTRLSGYCTLVLRVLTGFVSGPVFPAVQSIWGRWAPPAERSTLIAISFNGQLFGSVLGMSTSGFLCVYGFDNGWGSIFYIFGGVSLVFSFVWLYVVSDSPANHPNISKKEQTYLINVVSCKSKAKNIPWKKILTSTPVWAIVIAHTCSNWTVITFQLVLPLYMKEALHIDIKSNGLISSAPFIGQIIFSLLCGKAADILRSKNYMPIRTMRVLFQTICFIGSGSMLVAIGFLDSDQVKLIAFLFFMCGGSQAFFVGGFCVNHIDIAPKYAGILYGISNTFAAMPGAINPIITKALTPNKTRAEWQTVLYLCAGISLFGAIVYGVLASGTVQEWAETGDSSKKKSADNDDDDDHNDEEECMNLSERT